MVGQDSTVTCTIVTVGRHFEESYEILEGLGDGDVVATKGSNSLKDGSRIQVAKNN